MTSEDRSPEAIAVRLKGVAHIPITEHTPERGQHYGYRVGVGDNTLGEIWFCTDDRTHPDHQEYVTAGIDTADLYCNGHYASIDDKAALAFLLNAREDLQALLGLLGLHVELRRGDEDA